LFNIAEESIREHGGYTEDNCERVYDELVKKGLIKPIGDFKMEIGA